MTTSEPRIVALTDSTALVIGLTCAPTDWDVVCRPTDEVAPDQLADADVLVLDLGNALAALEVFAASARARQERTRSRRRRDPEPPRAVVIAEAEPRSALPAGVTVLLRPFTLPQLQDAINALLALSDLAASPAQAQEGATDAAGAIPAADDGTVADATDARAGTPPPLATRLFGRIASSQAPNQVALHEADDTPLATEAVTAPATCAPPSVNEVGDAEPPTEDLPPADEGLHGVMYLTPAPGGVHVDRPQPWFTRRPRTPPGDRQLRERLAAVLAATSELERLIDQVPLLESLDRLTDAIIGDVTSQFEADTAGLWRAGEHGYEVQAHRGLTAHEATWRVPFDHPLFGELSATGGAILIDPVDAVQAAVAGVGGAHTESLMAACIAAGPGRFGILVVGRNRPLTTRDLDRLIDLASEAAPGIAVAEQLARLRGPSVVIDLPDPEPVRSWHRPS